MNRPWAAWWQAVGNWPRWRRPAAGRLTQARWTRRFLDLLYPARCALCDGDLQPPADDRGALLCPPCRHLLLADTGPPCPRCGAWDLAGSGTADGCRWCRPERFAFAGVVALGNHRDLLRRTVLRAKQAGFEPLSWALADLVWQVHGTWLQAQSVDLIVPVPMHWQRRVARGVNSPDLLAERLADRLPARLSIDFLRRRRRTAPQAPLTRRQRQQNLRGAIVARRGFVCQGATVLLVDDILTTGATASAATSALIAAGAARVLVAVASRGVGE